VVVGMSCHVGIGERVVASVSCLFVYHVAIVSSRCVLACFVEGQSREIWRGVPSGGEVCSSLAELVLQISHCLSVGWAVLTVVLLLSLRGCDVHILWRPCVLA
jgi:hypothetical protein